jgi:hypothetical protein
MPRAAAVADALRIQNNIGARITRVEAKLATYKEWEDASASGHSFRTDPQTLVWVVGVEGSGLYCGMGSPLPMAPCRFAFSVAAANPPDEASVFGSNSQGWPAWFDRLADRDR